MNLLNSLIYNIFNQTKNIAEMIARKSMFEILISNLPIKLNQNQ